MRKWKKILIGLSLTFLITFVVAGWIFYNMLSSSLPQYTGESASSKISSNIEDYRDSFAVPYIIADSDEDVAFALPHAFMHYATIQPCFYILIHQKLYQSKIFGKGSIFIRICDRNRKIP